MKTTKHYIKYLSGIISEEQFYLVEAQINYPVLYTPDGASAIVPSIHEAGGIKDVDDNTKKLLKPIAKKGIWYEGIGEDGGGGTTEQAWVMKNLGVTASAKSYDNSSKPTIYQRCDGGMGPAVLIFSSLFSESNQRFLQEILNKTKGNTVRDAIKTALTLGGAEGAVPENLHEKFLNACFKDGLNLDAPKSEFINEAKKGEDKMWLGDGANPGTALGKIANKIEVDRRAIIVQMMKSPSTSGIYFIGSGHFMTMRQEHPDLTESPNQFNQTYSL